METILRRLFSRDPADWPAWAHALIIRADTMNNYLESIMSFISQLAADVNELNTTIAANTAGWSAANAHATEVEKQLEDAKATIASLQATGTAPDPSVLAGLETAIGNFKTTVAAIPAVPPVTAPAAPVETTPAPVVDPAPVATAPADVTPAAPVESAPAVEAPATSVEVTPAAEDPAAAPVAEVPAEPAVPVVVPVDAPAVDASATPATPA